MNDKRSELNITKTILTGAAAVLLAGMGSVGAARAQCTDAIFTAVAYFSTGFGTVPYSVAVGDFNLDGKPDLATANSTRRNVTILLGNGMGDFAQPFGSPIGLGISPYSVAVGDFNLDGQPDLATANVNAHNVTILLGNGLGGFTQPAGSPFGVGGINPFSVAVGDFNTDGKPDLATANQSTNNVSVLLGNGVGGFGTATNFNAGSGPFSIAVGDFDTDGKPDLATANLFSGNVTILLGDGLGGFTQPAGSPVGVGGVNPYSVAVGDFNLDGKPDLATTNQNPDNVTILLGDGLGGFTQPAGSPVGAGDQPVSVAVGDFNADGKPDMAIANLNSNNVTIQLGNGMGGFTQPAGSPFGPTGVGARSVAVGDFNLDGQPDLATADNNSSNVSVFVNTCTTNNPPVTIDDFYAGAALNEPGPGVLVNDSDPDAGDTLTAVLVTGPSHASSFQLNSDGSFTYVSLDNYNGPDAFTYQASDGTLFSSTGTVNITVRQPCPTGGFITGGGKYFQTGRKITFGFVARVQGTGTQGNLEFQDHDMGFNVAAGTLNSVYAPTEIDGSFSGTCRVNGAQGYTFFVQVHDRGQPGSNDDFSVWIYDANGAQVYTSGGLLSGGNILIHETSAVAGTTVEWFRDDDGDGYTVSAGFACTAPCPSCSASPGAGPDCDDNDPITGGTTTEWSCDNDGDGAWVPGGFSCTAPAGMYCEIGNLWEIQFDRDDNDPTYQ